MNRQVEVAHGTLRTITHPLMVHARVSEGLISFALMYLSYHKFRVLQTKDFINKDGNHITQFKLATGKKPSISLFHVLFFPCFVQKSTAHVGKKTLNTHH